MLFYYAGLKNILIYKCEKCKNECKKTNELKEKFSGIYQFL